MNKYKIDIELKSLTLPAGVGSDLQYDSEPHFDSFGFPYLPGKTFKGLSRESTKEVLEIIGDNEKVLIELYGRADRSGNYKGKLHFSSFYMPDYLNTIRPYLFSNEPTLQEIKRLRDYFTTAISRTALEDGVAKKGSLRTFATLDPTKVSKLESEFIADLSDYETSILDRSHLHLTRIGLARNRGLGLVKTRQNKIGPLEAAKEKIEWLTGANEIAVKVTLLAPLINNESGGDNFNIESGEVISGNKLIGLYASEYLESTKKVDDFFSDYFLNDKLKFSYLTKNGSSVIPLNIHYSKYDKPNAMGKPTTYYDLFSKDENKITKSLGGYYFNGEKLKVKKVRNLHTSRPVRTAGRAFEEEGNGDIFAIEALAPGQIFEGTISGQQDLLENFYTQFAGLENTRMGKSKYTQYGKIRIELIPRIAVRENISSADYMLVETPLVLLNRNGITDFSEESFNSYFPEVSFDFSSSVLSEQKIRSYRSDWQTPTDPITALMPGSIIKISNVKTDLPVSLTKGEFRSMGLGKVRLLNQNEMATYIDNLSNVKEDGGEQLDSKNIPPILKGFWNAIDHEISEQEFMYAAIKSAYNDFLNGGKVVSIRSSRISRVILALKTANDVATLENFFKNNNKSVFKDSGKELDEKGIFNMIARKTPSGANFSLYWEHYFKQIRKLKKSKENGQ